MSGEEDLDKNPFFSLLKNQKRELYDQAAKNRWIICVPQTRSLSMQAIDVNVLKTHIMQPSPYFQDEYVTLSGKCVTIKGISLPFINLIFVVLSIMKIVSVFYHQGPMY